MSAFPSLRFPFEIRTVGSRVFTRNRDGDDSAIWPQRRAVLRAFLLAVGICECMHVRPAQAAPLHAEASEVSIAQVTPGAKPRFAGRTQAGSVPHSAPDATPATLRKMAEDAATAHTLPVNYFLRLIGQESGFNPHS